MWNINKYTNREAFVTNTGCRITYNELEHIQKKCVNQMNNVGRLVFVISDNSIESIICYIACIQNKIPLMLIDACASDKDIMDLINAYHPKNIWQPKGCKYYKNFNVTGRFGNYILFSNNNKIPFYQINKNLALLMLTSGSTGARKTVRLSYDNLQSNTKSIIEALDIQSDDVAMVMLPICYAYGLSIINTYLSVGAKLLISNYKIIENKFWKFFSVHNGTAICGVPYMYEMLKKVRFDKLPLNNLKLITQAGGALKEETQQYLLEYAKKENIKLAIMYGQTEATARMSCFFLDQHPEKINSVGRVIPKGQFKIDKKYNEKYGQILYQGKNVFMGYADSYRDLYKEDLNKGKLYTGDEGYLDKDGYLYITGRINRIAKVLGKRLSLDDLESKISKLSGEEVYCIDGKEHIVVYSQRECNWDKVKNIIKALNFNYKLFHFLELDTIPYNANGKVSYKEMEKYWKDLQGRKNVYKKKREKILPITDIEIGTWAEQNFMISIVQNMDTGWDWIMNNFIQLRGSHYIDYKWNAIETNITFYPYSMFNFQPGMIDLCPFIDKYVIPKSMVTNNYGIFSSFVECAIDGNFYLCTYLDQFFRSTMHGRYGFHHPNFIYGYNNKNKQIYMMDNFEKGKFGTKIISYKELNRAYSLVNGDLFVVGVFLYRLYPFHHNFSPNYVKEQIVDYLEPERGICYLNRTICPDAIHDDKNYYNRVFFGINCYELLNEYLDDLLNEKQCYHDNDWRNLSMLCDHKHMMIQRYNYMLKNNYIKYNEFLKRKLMELEKMCVIVLNIFLKYALKGSKSYLLEIKKRLKEIKSLDIDCMKIFAESIYDKE